MTNVSQTHSSAPIAQRSGGTGKPDLLCPDWHESLQHGLCLAWSPAPNQQASGDVTVHTGRLMISCQLKCKFNDPRKPNKYVTRK